MRLWKGLRPIIQWRPLLLSAYPVHRHAEYERAPGVHHAVEARIDVRPSSSRISATAAFDNRLSLAESSRAPSATYSSILWSLSSLAMGVSDMMKVVRPSERKVIEKRPGPRPSSALSGTSRRTTQGNPAPALLMPLALTVSPRKAIILRQSPLWLFHAPAESIWSTTMRRSSDSSLFIPRRAICLSREALSCSSDSEEPLHRALGRGVVGLLNVREVFMLPEDH